MSRSISRRAVLSGSAIACLTAACPALMDASSSNDQPKDSRTSPGLVSLRHFPTRVFKSQIRSHEGLEGWTFNLIAETNASEAFKAHSMEVHLFKGGERVKTTLHLAKELTQLDWGRPHPTLPDGKPFSISTFWPIVLRIRHLEPAELGIDRVDVVLTMLAGGRQIRASATVPVFRTYDQKTRLVYPFRGRGIILQGGVNNGGHRNRSGQFAIDGFGLDSNYAIMLHTDDSVNANYVGWGRQILAPADGIVTHSRSDRPDQPVAGVNDPKYYSPEYADGGDVGNHVVIDHGSSEYSMIAHFMAGSSLVKEGDRVRQGQALGKLGASGDTSAPHEHYQLQSGPLWEYADGLPCKFTNVSETIMDRGTYFEAT
jgi:Peptidase family M23